MFVVLVSSDRCTYAKAGSPGTASRRRLDVPLDSAADINLNGLTLDESPHGKHQGSSASSGDIRHFLIPLQTVAHMYRCIYPSLVLVSAQLPSSHCISMSLESSLT